MVAIAPPSPPCEMGRLQGGRNPPGADRETGHFSTAASGELAGGACRSGGLDVVHSPCFRGGVRLLGRNVIRWI